METEKLDKPLTLNKIFSVIGEMIERTPPRSFDKIEHSSEYIKALLPKEVLDTFSEENRIRINKVIESNNKEPAMIQDDPCLQLALIQAILFDCDTIIKDTYKLDVDKLRDFLINLVFRKEEHSFSKKELEDIDDFLRYVLYEPLNTKNWQGSDVFTNPWTAFQMQTYLIILGLTETEY